MIDTLLYMDEKHPEQAEAIRRWLLLIVQRTLDQEEAERIKAMLEMEQ